MSKYRTVCSESRPCCLLSVSHLQGGLGVAHAQGGLMRIRERENQIGFRRGLVLNVLCTDRLIAYQTAQTTVIENARL
jgi:hypothetical protein